MSVISIFSPNARQENEYVYFPKCPVCSLKASLCVLFDHQHYFTACRPAQQRHCGVKKILHIVEITVNVSRLKCNKPASSPVQENFVL